ncbi:hypothetical protein [Sulfurovum riftiae]|uniref:hypothetical protein n=1 Tax=Sulfurovum riftiae TaxID=1630136 RepID=UPI00128FA088|nr:hypothetical protein [Sulfurovum riftiae]
MGEHQGFTRIVFDVTYWQGYGKPQAGKPADKAGHYTFTLHPDLSIEAELAGFRSTTTAIPSLPKGGIIRTIKRLSGEEYGDDSAVFYRITLRRNARLKAFTLKDPARIVLDVYE